jgi:choline transport protein
MAFDPSMADEKGTMGGAVAPADSPTYDPHPPKGETHLINASGHIQELSRHFSLWSLCGIAITTGNTWTAIGGSIAVAIYNGGPPGVLYEFIAVSVFYWLIAASIAELASSIPSSAGVYHWASIVSGPRKGRVAGFLAGWWNFLAWIFGAASMSAICGNQTVAMYALLHPEFVPQAWHVFVSYLLNTWLCCAIVLFFNRGLPKVGHAGGILILVGVLVTIVVCAVVPSKQGVEEGGYATGEQVWREWSNGTGWESDGFVFVAGMLNGAFAVGSVDCVTHLAEEIPRYVSPFFQFAFVQSNALIELRSRE